MTKVFPSKYVIDGPPAEPPRYSLLTIAELATDNGSQPEDADVARWQGGLEWLPEMQNQGGTIGYGCLGNTAALTLDHTVPSVRSAEPFLVYAEDHCSTFGFEAHDFGGRATRQLLATQSYQVAQEFEQGVLAQAGLGGRTYDNDYLTKNPTVVGSPSAQAPQAALGDVEMGLAALFGGARCMIHASPALLTALVVGNVLTLSGNKWLTPMQNIVVSDAGYTGDNGTSNQWLFGTGMVRYRISPVSLVPGNYDQAFAEATDRATNDVVIIAERAVLLQWDEGTVAAETNIPKFS